MSAGRNPYRSVRKVASAIRLILVRLLRGIVVCAYIASTCMLGLSLGMAWFALLAPVMFAALAAAVVALALGISYGSWVSADCLRGWWEKRERNYDRKAPHTGPKLA